MKRQKIIPLVKIVKAKLVSAMPPENIKKPKFLC